MHIYSSIDAPFQCGKRLGIGSEVYRNADLHSRAVADAIQYR